MTKPVTSPGRGGRYEMKDGKRVLVEEPTADHPDGNAPRDRHGKRLDRPAPDPAPSKKNPGGKKRQVEKAASPAETMPERDKGDDA